jgi:chromosome segregation ATPase
MLFADDAGSSLSGGNIATGLMMVATAIITYLSGRDRLKFSSRTQEMETQLAAHKKELADCHAEHKATKEELCVFRVRCDNAERTQSKMEGEMSYLKADAANMREEVNKLREMLMRRMEG